VQRRSRGRRDRHCACVIRASKPGAWSGKRAALGLEPRAATGCPKRPCFTKKFRTVRGYGFRARGLKPAPGMTAPHSRGTNRKGGSLTIVIPEAAPAAVRNP